MVIDMVMVVIIMFQISGNVVIGQNIFESICVVCYGVQGVGNVEVGLLFIYKIYEFSYYGDESFQCVVVNGVCVYYWWFGDMLLVEGFICGDVVMVIDYICVI